MKTETPITILANICKGYATDNQCTSAVAREQELIKALSDAYEAMLLMRGMLAKHADISLEGGPLKLVIEATGTLLRPPKVKWQTKP